MPDDKPKTFLDEVLERLPSAELVPLGYAVLEADDSPVPQLPAAPSLRHRASAYVCFPFYKPISRCFRSEQ